MSDGQDKVRVVRGIDEDHVEAALLIAYNAFAEKFRIGFSSSDDLIKLFGDSISDQSCFSATVDGRLAGILAFKTSDYEFFNFRLLALFTRFSPLRAFRMFVNMLLLDSKVATDVFHLDALAVDESYRGMGIGTALMNEAEVIARSNDKRALTLDVIGDNEGAIRLYERQGYRTVGTERGFFVKLVTGSDEAHRMEKPLTGD